MLVGPSCYNPAPARQVSINGILNPFQNDKSVARQALANNPQEAVTILDNGNPDDGDSTGRPLYTHDPLREASYQLLDIRPVGTLIFTDGDPLPTVSQINGGFKYTFAGARVTWYETGGQRQVVDVDIGAGTVFTVPPTHQLRVDLLVPNPRGIAEIPLPEDFATNQRFATTVSCKMTCVASPSIGLPTITRFVYIDGAQDFGVVGQQIAIPKGASSVQIFSSPAQGNTAPVDLAGNTEAFFAVEPVPLPPGVPVASPFDTWPVEFIPFSTDAQTLETARVRVPADFNVLRIRSLDDPTVRRNVCVVFEIDL